MILDYTKYIKNSSKSYSLKSDYTILSSIARTEKRLYWKGYLLGIAIESLERMIDHLFLQDFQQRLNFNC